MTRRCLRWIAVFAGVVMFVHGAPSQEVNPKLAKARQLAMKSNPQAALAAFEEALKDPGLTAAERLSCMRHAAYLYKNSKDDSRARQLVELALASEAPSGAADDVQRLRVFRVEFLLRDGKYDEAIAAARQIADDENCGMRSRHEAQRVVGMCLLRQDKPTESAAALERALTDLADKQLTTSVMTYTTLSDAYLEMGQVAKAVEAMLNAIRCEPAALNPTKKFRRVFLPQLRDKANAELADAAVSRIRQIIPGKLRVPAAGERVQSMLVELLVACGRYDEAILEGKLLVDVSSADTMSDAVTDLASLLKKADGTMARANMFLDYVRSGKPGPDGKLGTGDDIPDPLAEVRRPPDAERDAAFQEAVDAVKPGWKGRLAKASLYRYWGKRQEALAELHRALAECPMAEEPIQTIVDATIRVLIQLSGDPGVGARFADFQKFGPAGEDKKRGTDDDLTNPILNYLPEAAG